MYLFFPGKEEVKEGEDAKWTKKKDLPEVTKSWHDCMVKEVIQDFQHAVLQVSDTQYDEDVASNIPQVSYEFPNGYHNEFGVERFKIAEALFDPNKIRVPNANAMLSMAHVLTTSVGESKRFLLFRIDHIYVPLGLHEHVCCVCEDYEIE